MLFEPDSSVLVIFCRRPALGVGKQRIAKELGNQIALEAGQLLLAAAIEDARCWPGPVVIAPAEPTDADWAKQLLPGAIVIPQQGNNLGARINYVDRQIRAAGGQHLTFIGSDSPALTIDQLRQARASLDQHDAVIIPAYDGGVTLLASRLPWPDLTDLPWESDQLGSALKKLCSTANMSLRTLARGSDIDTCADLADAAGLLANDTRPARQQLYQWIRDKKLLSDYASLSVVIPVYRDTDRLRELLGKLRSLQPPVDEIIVVDSGSESECRSVCEHYDAIYLISAANRGAQLRLGAEQASGRLLWFLHADSTPPAAAVTSIRRHIEAGHTSGYFRFRFNGPDSWGKQLLAAAINLRARLGVPYGDQGIFVTREAYDQANGHAPVPLFEEVGLVKRLRQHHGCTPVSANILVSARRWETDGWIRRSLHNRWLAFCFACGVPPDRLARQYRIEAMPPTGQ